MSKNIINIATGEAQNVGYATEDRFWTVGEITKSGQPDRRKRGNLFKPCWSSSGHWAVGRFSETNNGLEAQASILRAEIDALEAKLSEAKAQLHAVYAGPKPTV